MLNPKGKETIMREDKRNINALIIIDLVHLLVYINVEIIHWYISSSSADSTDSFSSLLPSIPMSHCSWQVL